MRDLKQVILILILLGLSSSNIVTAQEVETMSTPEKTTEQIELEKATHEQKIAEAKLAEATAQKNLKDLNRPTSETKGLEGKFTLNTGAGYYSEILAFDSLKMATNDVAEAVKDKVGSKLIISKDFNIGQQFVLWSIINVRLTDYTSRLNSLIRDYTEPDGSPKLVELQSLSAALVAAPQILGAVADVAKFFKTDTELTARKVDITDNALLASTSQSILKVKPSAVVFIQGLNLSTTGKLVDDTQDLMQRQIDAKVLKADLKQSISSTLKELKDLRKELKELKAKLANEHDPAEKTKIQAEISAAQGKINFKKPAEVALKVAEKRFDELDAAIIKFIDSITARPENGISILERVAQVDTFKADSSANMLAIEVSSSGGEIERKSSVLLNDRIRYLGGVVLSYVLFNNSGAMLASGVVPIWKSGKLKTSKQ